MPVCPPETAAGQAAVHTANSGAHTDAANQAVDGRALVRAASSQDQDTLAKFNQAMAKETEDLDLPYDIVLAGVTAVLEEKAAAKYYVVEVASQVVGQLMLTYEWSDWRARNIWWIQSVYVLPDHRQQGYFRMLYQYVHEAAKQQGAAGLRLYADVNNVKAHETYKRLGMTSHYQVFEDMLTDY